MQDIQCIRCGYGLQGLAPAGRCPECATRVADSIRLWRSLTARGRRMVLAAAVAGAVAFVGWLPLAAFAFERVMPDAMRRIMLDRIFDMVSLQVLGAIGFAATGAAIAATVVLLPAVLGWRGRTVRAAMPAIAALVLAEGLVLASVTSRGIPSVTAMERLVFGQALAGLAAAALWGRVHVQVTGGRWQWPMAVQAAAAASLLAFECCTGDFRGLFPSFDRADTVRRVFVACTLVAFAADVAMGIACLRSRSLALEKQGKPLPDAHAE